MWSDLLTSAVAPPIVIGIASCKYSFKAIRRMIE